VVEPAEEKQMIKPKAAPGRKNISNKGSKKRHTSRWSRITVFDVNGAPAPLFPAGELLLTSAGRAWTGITVEGHHLPPIQFPERTAKSHLIAVHFRPARLVWFLGGRAQTNMMKRGSLDIVPQGTLLGGYSKDETEFLMLALDPGLVERVASEAGAANYVELIRKLGIRDSQIQHICMALKSELEADCPSGRLYGDALAVALAAHLLAHYAVHLSSAHGHSAGLPACKLRRVIEYINDNLSEDLTLAELAQVAAMNPHYFSRAFKQATGTPPHRYVTNCRVEKAKTLLADDELPLVEIGLSVGFQNQSHFTTLFHKFTGVTPKAYRDGH
jgi:AraC family transcriptional regulator